MTRNRRIVLASRPPGLPEPSNFRLEETAVPEPAEGQALVEVQYLSVDPYMRGRMRDAASYAPPAALDQVMTGRAVGRVVRSRLPRFPEGTYVEGMLGWQEYALTDGSQLRRIDPDAAPLSAYLGVLGMPGLTAWFGLLDVGQPKPGETVLVSGAAGAVGSVVGQIAKLQGCRAVGIAGSDAKVDWITRELGFDAGFNYRTSSDYGADLARLCPQGVDVYFDNVGGPITDAVFPRLNQNGRVSVCGQIAQYNDEQAQPGPRLLWHCIVKRLRIQGFLVSDYAPRYREAMAQLTEWVRAGQLKWREEIAEGLENAPAAFIGLFHGANTGKQLVRIATGPS